MSVAFVGNGFHIKYTKSSQFFIQLLKARWPNLKVVSEEWAWARLPEKKWDVVVFWQQMPSLELLNVTSARTIALVPMYDDCSKERSFWEPYRGASIVCFSARLADMMEAWGHRTFRVQYFPEVPDLRSPWNVERLTGFFWPRKENLNWATIKILMGNTLWDRFFIHETDSLEQLGSLISEEDREKYHVVQTSWSWNPMNLRNTLAQSQIFFAPRRQEGIGMSFLEAMALGMCVVAPADSTMDEYIQSGKNGILYDPDRPQAIDFSNAEVLGKAARKTVELGRVMWESSKLKIQEFLEPQSQFSTMMWTRNARRLRTRNQIRYYLYLLWEPLRWAKRFFRNLFLK